VSNGLLDTSVFTATETARPMRHDLLPDRLFVSVITIGELRAGVLAAADVDTRDRRLATLTEALAFDPLPVDEHVAEAWARLRITLRDLGRRMPVNDSWIAATAIAWQMPIVTQDQDFQPIQRLGIVHV
jgi:predicted nucleic acid-binding protein